MSERFVLGQGLVDKLRETVRTVDGLVADGTEAPTRLTFDEPAGPSRGIRIGTFGTAAWAINGTNTVTLSNVGVTGYTVAAVNIFGNLPVSPATQSCAIAKDGTSWYLIQPFVTTASGSLIRLGTFNSPWSTGNTNTVTLANAGGTVAATNTLINYPSPPAGKSTVNCVVANDGSSWFLTNWEQVTATAAVVTAFSTATVVTDVSLSATLNTSSCAITIGKTNATSLITVVAATQSFNVLRLA